MDKAHYRSDIQGMRCLAVLLVFLAHAKIPMLAGGFVGVDVFFVISGYVISGLLLRQHAQSQRFQLMAFYGQRMLRLFPALLVMVAVSLWLMVNLLPPSEQLPQLEAVTPAVAYYSNLYFLFQDLNYFNPTVQDNLFLHTWSLAVEEQFYLIWPLVMLWLLRKQNNSQSVPFVAKAWVVVGFSLLLMVLLTQASGMYGFYLMPARMWQFMLGGIIAWQHVQAKPNAAEVHRTTGHQVGSLIGLGLILTAAVSFNEHHPYPGWRAMVPSLGAAMLLFFWQPHQAPTWVGRVLSTRPMVWVGNWSYSFYLWHWVVLLLFARLQFFVPWLNVWLALLLTGLLAVISYHVIENPLRRHHVLRNRPQTTLLIAVVLIGLMALWVLQWRAKALAEQNQPHWQQLASVQQDAPMIYQYECDTWYHSAAVTDCWFGAGQTGQKVVLFGDSMAAQWFPLLAAIYPPDDWHVVVITKSACPVVDEPFYYPRIGRQFTVCEQWRQRAVEHIQSLKPEVLVMGSAGLYPFTGQQWRDGTSALLDQLLPHVEQIKIIAASPPLNFHALPCLSQAHWLSERFAGLGPEQCQTPLHEVAQWDHLAAIARQYERVAWLNMAPWVCPNTVCSAFRDGQYIYRDDKHLTASFVRSLAAQVSDLFNTEQTTE